MFLDELCAEVRNYFVRDLDKDIIRGTFTAKDGSIAYPSITDGQYYRIVGSVYNDGIHCKGDELLEDETFDGEIWLMHVPMDFVMLANEIENWQTANAETLNSPYTSESFGGYSYSKGSGGTTANGGATAYGWRNQYAARLNRYRKLVAP